MDDRSRLGAVRQPPGWVPAPQEVAALLEHLGEVHAVALAAREPAHLLLWLGPLRVGEGYERSTPDCLSMLFTVFTGIFRFG